MDIAIEVSVRILDILTSDNCPGAVVDNVRVSNVSDLADFVGLAAHETKVITRRL